MHEKCKKVQRNTIQQCTKTAQASAFSTGSRFFFDFWVPLGSPRGLPGRPGRLPEAFQCFCDALLCLKTTLDGVLGGPGEVPGHLQVPPRDHFGRILGRYLKSIFRRTAMATLSVLWILSSDLLTFCHSFRMAT